ncbi:unnamed protein product [Fraxinus pennsylvanica]|uniref:Morc S5 domain-containing protein n=1 Tax=Fraxinus pennsylvanica TaxID=56036 RepID=A0AAD1ZXH5_9LAMI|nr:unnamed protein product [Fraxinus pennsylvanica]
MHLFSTFRILPSFRIILRGKDVEHHNIVNDMMMPQEVTYNPQPGTDGVPKDANMVASISIGCVKDAKAHIDVQGFNVCWKPILLNQHMISKGLSERTTVLARLEAQLIQMQKTYRSSNCHHIGYSRRRNKKACERVTIKTLHNGSEDVEELSYCCDSNGSVHGFSSTPNVHSTLSATKIRNQITIATTTITQFFNAFASIGRSFGSYYTIH